MAHDVANEETPSLIPGFIVVMLFAMILLAGRFVALSINGEVRELSKRVQALEAKQ